MDKSQFADVENLDGRLEQLTTDDAVDSDVESAREVLQNHFGWGAKWYSKSENATGLHDCLETIWEQLVEHSSTLKSDFDAISDASSQGVWVKKLAEATSTPPSKAATSPQAGAPAPSTTEPAPPEDAELWDEARGITVTTAANGQREFGFGGRTLSHQEVTEAVAEYDALTLDYADVLDDATRAAIAADPDANVGAATDLILQKLAERAGDR